MANNGNEMSNQTRRKRKAHDAPKAKRKTAKLFLDIVQKIDDDGLVDADGEDEPVVEGEGNAMGVPSGRDEVAGRLAVATTHTPKSDLESLQKLREGDQVKKKLYSRVGGGDLQKESDGGIGENEAHHKPSLSKLEKCLQENDKSILYSQKQEIKRLKTMLDTTSRLQLASTDSLYSESRDIDEIMHMKHHISYILCVCSDGQPLVIPSSIDDGNELVLLVKRILGRDPQRHIPPKALTTLLSHFPSMATIRALTASVLYDWVFKSDFPNFDPPDGPSLLKKYRENLARLDFFKWALKLKANLLINTSCYEMVFRPPGTAFDAATMDVENMDGHPVKKLPRKKGKAQVKLCLLPLIYAHQKDIVNDAPASSVTIDYGRFIEKNEREREKASVVKKATVIIDEPVEGHKSIGPSVRKARME
ncbi:MAG: hypothetical protein M1816_003107 [Peltula sp. TS41687]|nr:MAG: hypothetical protein M1816_003107 [Peltula sp. TS41687]